MKKTALIIMIITLLSKFLGFGREMSLAYVYGASNISDAYLISVTIPITIFGFISAGLMIGYIPVFSKVRHDEGKKRATEFTNNLIVTFLCISSIIILLCIVFIEPIVKLFAMGFDEQTFLLTVKLSKITLFSIYFSSIVAIFTAYLQLNNNYYIPAIIGLPMNFAIIASIFLSEYSINMLPLGYILGIFLQGTLLIICALKMGYKFSFKINLNDKYIINLLKIGAPLILGLSVNQINVLVDRTLASSISVGGISSLNYANRLNGFVQGIFVFSIATVLYPNISSMAASKDFNSLKKIISQSIIVVAILVIPTTVGSMIFSTSIISMLFARGDFSEVALEMTSNAFFYYSLGMIGFGLRDIISRVFYALQDSRKPAINAAVGMVINIILNIILSKYLGLGGLALATSISALVTTILLFGTLRKKIGPFGMKQTSISFLKILFASLVMGLLSKLCFNYLTTSLSQNLSLLLAIGVGAVSYFVIIYFMKIEDVDVIIDAVKKKIGRGTAKG